MPSENTRYAVSVLAPDRVGIIAHVSETIYNLGGNFVAISQTTSQGWFTMVAHAEFPETLDVAQVREALEAADDVQVLISKDTPETDAPSHDGEPFVVTVVGKDKPGIVRGLAQFCCTKQINIDDVWNEVCQDQFIVIFHVTVPRDIDAKDARYELEQVGESLGVSVMMQHQDIFTATNSLSVRTRKQAMPTSKGLPHDSK